MQMWDNFKSDFLKRAAEIIEYNAKDLERVRMQLKREVSDKDDYENELLVLTTQIRLSFERVLSSYCAIVNQCRGIRVERTNVGFSNGLAPFEQGLFLDFLAGALRFGDRISKRFEIKEIPDSMDSRYPGLRNAYKSKALLWKNIEYSQRHYQKRDEWSSIKVYQADLPYLEFYHVDKRDFPWQRRAGTNDIRKYAFNIMGQAFQYNCSGECIAPEEVAYMELLDWHLRERYWGINFAAELSRYAPELNQKITDDRVRQQVQNLWETIIDSPDFLKRFMAIPYPAYRVSFIQSFGKWFFTNEEFLRQTIDIRSWPIMELVVRAGALLPEPSDYASHETTTDNIVVAPGAPAFPKEITVSNLDKLMVQATCVSMLMCMEFFAVKHMPLQGENSVGLLHEWSVGRLEELLENPEFWKLYKAAVYDLFCDDIYKRYRSNDKRVTGLSEIYPLILMPADDFHAKRLLEMKTQERHVRLNDAHAVAYSQVQAICYSNGMRN